MFHNLSLKTKQTPPWWQRWPTNDTRPHQHSHHVTWHTLIHWPPTSIHKISSCTSCTLWTHRVTCPALLMEHKCLCVCTVCLCVAGVVRWQLLCTVVCVASWGGGSPDPQTVSDDPDPRSRNSRSDCWTEADKQQNDWGSDSRWTAAVGGADDSLSVCNLSDDRDHCSLTPPPPPLLLRLYEHSHSDAVCLCGCILEEKLRYSKTLAKGFHLLL